MQQNRVIATRIPGKIMLSGEYVVLRGEPCLAATVSETMTVTVRSAAIGFTVRSDLWSEEECFTDATIHVPTNPFSQAVCLAAREFGLAGADVHADAGIALTAGFGSSSALRLGVIFGLYALAYDELPDPAKQWELARLALALQRDQQRWASGYDFATQLHGGLVRLSFKDQHWPGACMALELGRCDWLHIMIGPTGNKTALTVDETMTWLCDRERWSKLVIAMNELTEEWSKLFGQYSDHGLKRLIHCVAAARLALKGSPAFPSELVAILEQVEGCDESWSFKTSGAGGQDALILVGAAEAVAPARIALDQFGWRLAPQSLTASRLTMTKN